MDQSRRSFFLFILLIISSIYLWNFFINNKPSSTPNFNYGTFTQGTDHIIDKPKTNIYFLGDLMLGRNVERRLQKNGVASAFKNFNFLEQNTYVVANFEAAVPVVHQPTPDFNFQFSVSEASLLDLKAVGITHVSLANNHAFDFGKLGYENTLIQLEKNNVTAFGNPTVISTSSITYLELEKNRVAIIALMTIDEFLSKNDLKEVFTKASQNSDIQIVFVHWGSEYNQTQSASQRNQAKVFSDLGAELVIGHHPHVVQGIEWLDNTLVFYSLGNFIFDQYFSRQVQEGLMLDLSFKENIKIKLIPVTSIDSRVQPKYMNEENQKVFLRELADLSQEGLYNEIISAEINYLKNLATSSEVVIMTP